VRLVRLDDGDKVAAIACVVKDETGEEPQDAVEKVEKED
jgi:DNA gyrase subunit A